MLLPSHASPRQQHSQAMCWEWKCRPCHISLPSETSSVLDVLSNLVQFHCMLSSQVALHLQSGFAEICRHCMPQKIINTVINQDAMHMAVCHPNSKLNSGELVLCYKVLSWFHDFLLLIFHIIIVHWELKITAPVPWTWFSEEKNCVLHTPQDFEFSVSVFHLEGKI